MKWVLAAVLLAVSSLAFGQDSSLGVRLRLGYGWTGSFDNRAGNSMTLSGPEIGAILPMVSSNGYSLAFEPSYLIAGRIIGNGAKGDVYHFTLTGTKWVNKTTYGKIGAGFAHASIGNGEFASQDSWVVQAGIGVSLGTFISASLHTAAEANIYEGNSGQVRGFFVGLTGGF